MQKAARGSTFAPEAAAELFFTYYRHGLASAEAVRRMQALFSEIEASPRMLALVAWQVHKCGAYDAFEAAVAWAQQALEMAPDKDSIKNILQQILIDKETLAATASARPSITAKIRAARNKLAAFLRLS